MPPVIDAHAMLGHETYLSLDAGELLRRMDASAYTVHGFRSSFKTWATEETSFPNELSEQALAHVTGNQVERAYRRTDVLERRRKLMDAWARFVEGGNVVPMRKVGS